jgi:hypothetical protein
MRRAEMSWSFWKKKSATVELSEPREEKLSKPKDIPEPVGRYLVVDLGRNPDWVWNLKGVVRRQGEKHRYDVRVFDDIQARAKGIRIRDYATLDDHPGLILFEGWYDKKSNMAHVQETLVPTPKAA